VTALAGLRVLDLTRLLPGPFCTMLLGDLGADVIKVEEPDGGDPARHGASAAVFQLVNRNKRSITLDLKTPEGHDRLLRMVDRADVLVEGYRPGVMDRLRLGYANVLAKRNPRLIYASLSGFGQSGPYQQRAGHDLNYLALAGVLGYNVDSEAQPVMPAVQIADLGAGALAAIAILAAVVSRQQTGTGQAVDVSLFGAAIAFLPTLLAPLLSQGGAVPPGEVPLAGGLPQYGIYATADGRHVTLGALEPKFLLNFLERVGRPDLQRVDTAQLRSELIGIFASRTLAEWVDCLADVDTCFAPVNMLDETLEDPQVKALEMISPTNGQIAPPFTFSATPAQIRRPAPRLGEHTNEIMREFEIDV
jgi:crotonobetainyl-CoA:carnitine CoA-transferase CaiB-like acyl-CoA transferase